MRQRKRGAPTCEAPNLAQGDSTTHPARVRGCSSPRTHEKTSVFQHARPVKPDGEGAAEQARAEVAVADRVGVGMQAERVGDEFPHNGEAVAGAGSGGALIEEGAEIDRAEEL